MCEKKNPLPTVAITMSEHLDCGCLPLVRNDEANRSASGAVYLYVQLLFVRGPYMVTRFIHETSTIVNCV